jgi:hypothetical protein
VDPTDGSDVPDVPVKRKIYFLPRSMASAVADLREKLTLVTVVDVLQKLMNKTGKR